MGLDLLPDLVQPACSVALHVSTGGDHPSSRRRQQVEGGRRARGGRLGVHAVGAVGLVHGDHVGQLEHALLDPLQAVAGAGQHQHQERVDHVGDRDLRLADADGLDEHDVEAGRLDDDDRLARRARHAAERAGARRRAHERAGRRRRAGPCASCRRGCCRRCASTTGRRPARRPGAGRRQLAAEGVDERRLADAGHPGDADAVGAAGVGQQRARAAPAPRSDDRAGSTRPA